MRKLFLLIALAAGYCQAQVNPSVINAKIDSIFAKYNNKTGPGCALAVISDGSVVLKKTYGMANLEYGQPITDSSVFDIASLSKQFTGFAIATLIEAHKINEGDDIRKYLPDVPDFGKTITIRHLLHHTSGLRDWPEALNAAGWHFWEECAFDDIMKMVRDQRELDFDPGAQYSYSNTGYNVLAALVAKVTGMSFRQWTNENIFKPLGMNSTRFLDNADELIPNLVSSYYMDHEKYYKIPDVLTAYGSSSLFTSIDDLSKWVIHFQKEVAAKDPVFLRMLKTDTLNDGTKSEYAYGLLVKKEGNLATIVHNGSWAGFRTIIKNYPEEKISFIQLSNGSDNSMSNTFANAVIDLFLGNKRLEDANKNALPKLPVIHPDSPTLKKMEGIYAWGGNYYYGGPGYITIKFEKDQLQFQYSGEDFYPMTANTDSSFWLDESSQPVIFRKDQQGRIKSIFFRNQEGKMVTLITLDSMALLPYCGSYASAELHTSYTVDIKNGKLYIHHFRTGDFGLDPHPALKDCFIGDPGKIWFFRSQDGKVSGFKLSGGRVRNIRFDKTL